MDLIRLGDSTDHGGKVIGASPTMVFDDRRVARKGEGGLSQAPRSPYQPDFGSVEKLFDGPVSQALALEATSKGS